MVSATVIKRLTRNRAERAKHATRQRPTPSTAVMPCLVGTGQSTPRPASFRYFRTCQADRTPPSLAGSTGLSGTWLQPFFQPATSLPACSFRKTRRWGQRIQRGSIRCYSRTRWGWHCGWGWRGGKEGTVWWGCQRPVE